MLRILHSFGGLPKSRAAQIPKVLCSESKQNRASSKAISTLTDSGSRLFHPAEIRRPDLPSRQLSTKSFYVEFIPPIYKNAKIVLPISMGRYNTTNPTQQERAIQEVNALLTKTADMLTLGEVASVDVICTASLHTDWGKDKTDSIENLFFDAHSALLQKQSAVYSWDSWIKVVGKSKYAEILKIITDKSEKGSRWYDLMVTTHESVNMSSDLEFSLQYQRAEYAAIFLMQKYTNLVYMGQVSPAWSFLYELFPDIKLPLFTRASLKSKQQSLALTPADTSHTVRMIFEMVEKTLTNPSFPDKEKTAIATSLTSLFYAYAPKRKNKSEDESNKNDKGGPTHSLKI